MKKTIIIGMVVLIVLISSLIIGCSSIGLKKTKIYNAKVTPENAEQYLDDDKCESRVMEGVSMYPTIKQNSLMMLCPIEMFEIEIDDIICWNITSYCLDNECTKGYINYTLDMPCCHRVIKLGEDEQGKYWITRGDNLRWWHKEKVREKDLLYMVIGGFD